MTEADIQSITLFFYFALLDDKKAIEASSKALVLCRDRKNKNSNLKNAVVVVASTKAVWDKYKSRVSRGRPNTSVESGWLIPESIDLGPWREFQKTASEDELLTVIWSKILKFADDDISEGLGITQGTIRYRLGRALRKLGSMTQGASKFKYGGPEK
ncbi:MAG: helix-turn-helix transcriptional regulator [Pseudobdellovibrionaceae bacterium]